MDSLENYLYYRNASVYLSPVYFKEKMIEEEIEFVIMYTLY